MPVNNERIDMWIAALRSGKYKQGKHTLTMVDFNGNEFDCCLGVACKLNRSDIDRVRSNGEFKYFPIDDELRIHATAIELPERMRQWLGIETCNGVIDHPFMLQAESKHGASSHYTLALLNDDGLTFNQIADVIDFFREFL